MKQRRRSATKMRTRLARPTTVVVTPIPDIPPIGGPSGAGYAAEARYAHLQRLTEPPPPTTRRRKTRRR
jgi:hypothetical protein